jgi:hypothetical protein
MTSVDSGSVAVVGALDHAVGGLAERHDLTVVKAARTTTDPDHAERSVPAAVGEAVAQLDRALAAAGSCRVASDAVNDLFDRMRRQFGVLAAVYADGELAMAVGPRVQDAPGREQRRRTPRPARSGGSTQGFGRPSQVVAVTQFGLRPGPYLAPLAEGRALAIAKRATVVVEIHPMTEDRFHELKNRKDPRWSSDDVPMAELHNNPSDILKRFGSGDRLGVLRRHNDIVGLILPAGHWLLAGRDARVRTPAPLPI